MHREPKLLMLQLALILFTLFPFNYALTTALPECYVSCAKKLDDDLACDLTKSDDCTCSQSFLDALGCCIVEDCWVSHSGATFRIPCGDEYQDASCAAKADEPSSTTSTKSSGGMGIMATPTGKNDDDDNDNDAEPTSTDSDDDLPEHSLIAATAGTEIPSSSATSDASSSSSSGPDAGTIGLGVGLGLGIPGILAAIGLVAFFYRRGRRSELAERQQRLYNATPSHQTPSHHRSSPPSTLVDAAVVNTVSLEKSGPSIPGSPDAMSNGPPRRGGPSNGNGTPLMVELPA